MALRKALPWKSIGIFCASGVSGGGLALLAALLMVLASAKTQLAAYATDFLTQDEKIARNVDATLAAANGAEFASCSDMDLALLRDLLFRSPYLKDVGRVEGNALACSAVAGRMDVPIERSSVAHTTYRGRTIFYNVDLQIAKGERAEVVAEGRSNVVVSPDVFSDFSRSPMLFAGAIVDREQKKVLQMYTSSATPLPLELMLGDKAVSRDGFLYRPMCSATRPDCVLTAMPTAAVWAQNYGLLAGASAMGAVIGVAIAAIFWLMDRRKRSLASQLRRGLKRKKLGVVYQPIVDAHTHGITGCEALARWRDEDQRVVRPELFVGIAEDEGFIGELTMFVVERVLMEMGDLLRERAGFRVSVNLSAKDLADEGFPTRLDELLKIWKVPAASLGLELTERCAADKHVAIDAIRRLRDRGHVVYIDDFGMGYSSLSYLHELQVDVLKIDRVFTNTIGTDSITASIVPQILSMAQALKLKVVVEGVEHQAQADYLEKFSGAIEAQGWLFGRPVPSAELRDWLREEETAEASVEGEELAAG